MKSFARLLTGLLVFFASFAAVILAVEFFLRTIHFKPPAIVTPEKYADVGNLYQPNSRTIWSGRLGQIIDFENEVMTNSLALHDSEHERAKKPDVYRILVLGDSFVEAHQVPLQHAFFKILEKNLTQKSKRLFGKDRVEVIAIGQSGIGSLKEEENLKNLGLSFSPDLVITLLVANDYKDDVFFLDRAKNPGKYRRPANIFHDMSLSKELGLYRKMLIFKNSVLNRWLAFKIFQIVRKPKIEAEHRDAYGEDLGIYAKDDSGLFESGRVWNSAFLLAASNHVRMAKLSSEKGAGYLTVFVPDNFIVEAKASEDLYALFPEYRGHLDFERPVSVMKKLLGQNGVKFLDMNGAFKESFRKNRRLLHFRHDGHWNVEGHGLVALLIEDYLEKNFEEGKLKP